MSGQSSMAGKNHITEPRPAQAGGALYVQLKRNQRTHEASKHIRVALESFTPTKAEAGVIITSLKMLQPVVLRPGLEADEFHQLDPNDMSFFDTGKPGQDGENPDEDFVDTVTRHASNLVSRTGEAISSLVSKIRKETVDFYDARVRWYGDLEKEIATIGESEAQLDGAPFVNTQMVGALAGRPANQTYDSPVDRAREVSQESMKVMLLAEEIKTDAANVARSMAANKPNLGTAVENLVRKIRGSAEQQGDNLIWNYPSFSSIVHAAIPRGTDLNSIVADDFKVNTIKTENGKQPAVPQTLQRATSSDLQMTKQLVRGGQMALNNAIQKNDKDILAGLANTHQSEEGLTESQINGVKSLLIFANRIHENLAMAAQQSYYNAVYLAVYWIHVSVRDNARTQKREAEATQQPT